MTHDIVKALKIEEPVTKSTSVVKESALSLTQADDLDILSSKPQSDLRRSGVFQPAYSLVRQKQRKELMRENQSALRKMTNKYLR